MRGPVVLPRPPSSPPPPPAFPGGRVAGGAPRPGGRAGLGGPPPPGLPLPPVPPPPLPAPVGADDAGAAAAPAASSTSAAPTPARGGWWAAIFAPGPESDAARNAKLAAAGGVAGAVSRTATAPLDRVKLLMIMGHPGSPTRLSARAALAAIAAERSLPAWFRGNGVNVAKNVPETAVKLAANDALQRAWLTRGGGGGGGDRGGDRGGGGGGGGGDAPTPSKPRHLGVLARLAAGSAAGGLAQALVYPLEVVQTRLAASPAGTYRGAAQCARAVWAREGPAAFGRGLVPTLVGLVPYAGVDIAAFELLKEALSPVGSGGGGGGGGGADGHALHPPPAATLMVAGVASSTAAQVAAYPLGFVRVRLQMDGLGGSPRRYKGMLHCFAAVAAKEGVAGLYKGFGPNLAKTAPCAALSWWVYEAAKAGLGCPDVVHSGNCGGGRGVVVAGVGRAGAAAVAGPVRECVRGRGRLSRRARTRARPAPSARPPAPSARPPGAGAPMSTPLFPSV